MPTATTCSRSAVRSPTRSGGTSPTSCRPSRSQLGVSRMVGLGAYPFATPHTREPRLSSTSPSADVVDSVSYLKNSVDVPAGMGAVLEHAFTDKGIPALGIWAQVPHYVSAMSYPAATLALLTGLHEVAGLVIDAADDPPGDHHPAPAARPTRGRQRRTRGDGRAARGALRQPEQTDLLGTAADPHRRRAGRRVRTIPARPGHLTGQAGSAKCSARRRTTVGAMKVDGGISSELTKAAASAKETEAAGYSGAWTAETSHDPFFPLAAGRRAHRTARARHVDRRRVRPQPDDLGHIGWDLQAFSKGRFIARSRQPDQAAHHQAVQHGVEPPGAAHARDDPGHPGDLGHVAERHASWRSAASSTRTR